MEATDETTSAEAVLGGTPGVPPSENGQARTYERSTIRFPYGDLDDAIEVVRVVREHGGGQADMSQLAAWMNHDTVRSGAFRTKVATARIFGLVDVDRDTVTLTPVGGRIVDPTMEREARVTAFRNVPLFEQIFERFKGLLLPPDSGLESEIVRLGVSDGQKRKARQIFQRSAAQAGFFAHGRERLVLPAVGSYPNGETTQASASASERDEPMEHAGVAEITNPTASMALHPAVRGLFQAVPPAGSPWDSDDQEAWLEALRNVFRFVYKSSKRPQQTQQ